MKNTFFPDEFIAKYSKILGSEWDVFFETIKRRQPRSFWVNLMKANPAEIMTSLKKKNVSFRVYSFSPNAFQISLKKPSELSEFLEGKISLQEKASMFPAIVLNPTKEDVVLDACSAPGMKTIQLSGFAKKVIASELNERRFDVLKQTIKSFGLTNVEPIRSDFRNIEQKFDKILLDAPCSSEGLVRKDWNALKEWNQLLVKKKAAQQKKLIIAAFDKLNSGGEMVYSTCSFAQEENEDVVNHLLKERAGAKTIPIILEGIKMRENKICPNTVRFYPQDNDTQQFFVSKIKKI
jgi:NOL1/NOP2/sun family putative RNA methylase